MYSRKYLTAVNLALLIDNQQENPCVHNFRFLIKNTLLPAFFTWALCGCADLTDKEVKLLRSVGARGKVRQDYERGSV